MQSLKSFTVADMLIDIGGFSLALYFLGMVCCSFMSKILQKQALIEEIFMIQKPTTPKTDPKLKINSYLDQKLSLRETPRPFKIDETEFTDTRSA